MFTDSKVAWRYSQYVDKTLYVVVYGNAPYVKNVLNDVKNTFFCYKFDKTTTI